MNEVSDIEFYLFYLVKECDLYNWSERWTGVLPFTNPLSVYLLPMCSFLQSYIFLSSYHALTTEAQFRQRQVAPPLPGGSIQQPLSFPL